MLMTKEFYDLMAQFERTRPGRIDREAKELWSKGLVYQDGRVNEAFQAFQKGYAYGKFAFNATCPGAQP